MPDIRDMIGKDVEVISGGMSYKGTLIEVSDSEVTIKTMLQWLSLPTTSVSQITLEERRGTPVADRINVEESETEQS